ncbi:MAG: hypothetical protein AAFW84_16890 [Cyanobacteria bacterium J06635_15]
MVQPKFSKQNGLLLLVGIFWAAITGVFFSLPELSGLIGLGGLAIAIFYAGMVCLFQRPIIYLSIGITCLLAIIFPSPESLLVNYGVGMTLSINFLIFGNLGITLLKLMTVRQAFIRLAGLFAGALGLGWSIAVLFG